MGGNFLFHDFIAAVHLLYSLFNLRIRVHQASEDRNFFPNC